MADVTKNQAVKNDAAEVTAVAGAASQTIVYDRNDEKILIRVLNTDAATVLVTLSTNGYGGEDATDLTQAIAQNEVFVFSLESMYFKAPSTGKVTMLLTDADGTEYSGTVTNVKIEVIDLPKSLVD